MQERIASVMKNLPPVSYVVRILAHSVWDMGAGPTAGEKIS